MKLVRRKHGSQRAMQPIELTLFPELSGDASITFRGSDGIYYTIAPETRAEMNELLSEARVAQRNWHGT